jgi:hypothetical protein
VYGAMPASGRHRGSPEARSSASRGQPLLGSMPGRALCLADERQGRETVSSIRIMKLMRTSLLVLGTVVLGWNTSSFAGEARVTLCRQGEEVFFSCPVKDGTRIVSLCGSRRLTAQEGYLQYRFGRPGKLELEHPKRRQGAQETFRYAHYSRYQVDRVAVSFQRGGFTYTLFDSYEGDAPPPARDQGVQVTPSRAGRKEVTLACRGAATGNLSSLSSILPCDKDDPLNMGECR